MAIRAFFSPYFARWAQYGLFFRPISPVGLNTGFFSPYFARWAQYGLFFRPIAVGNTGFFFALFRPLGSIRAFFRPISPVGLNTGFFFALLPLAIRAFFLPYFARWAQYGLLAPYFASAQYGLLAAIARWAIRRLPGVALRLPRAVFWRSFPSPNRQRPPRRASILPRMPSTPATSGVYSPSHAINARHVGRLFSLACHQRPPRRASILPCMPSTPATSGVHPPLHAINARRGGRPSTLAIYGEGVADRPGGRSIPPPHASQPAPKARAVVYAQ